MDGHCIIEQPDSANLVLTTLPSVISVNNISNAWSEWKFWSECDGGCDTGLYVKRRLCFTNCFHTNPLCVTAPSSGQCISVMYQKKRTISDDEQRDEQPKCHMKSDQGKLIQGSATQLGDTMRCTTDGAVRNNVWVVIVSVITGVVIVSITITVICCFMKIQNAIILLTVSVVNSVLN